MNIKVLESSTTQENLERRSASFYNSIDYYRGLLEDYSGVIIRQSCNKTSTTVQSDIIAKGDFLNQLREFSTDRAQGLYIRY